MDAYSRAFEFFGGFCVRGLYDNRRTVVTEVLMGKDRVFIGGYMRGIIPLQQGNLDGLCGPYSIVNAIRKVKGELAKPEAMKLFLSVLSHLYYKKQGLEFLVEGISTNDMGTALQEVVEPMYGILRSKLYNEYHLRGLQRLWFCMSEFLGMPRRAIIIGIRGTYDHWTVVDSITDKRISLLDSGNRILLNRCSFTTTERATAKRRHRLVSTHVYFLEG